MEKIKEGESQKREDVLLPISRHPVLRLEDFVRDVQPERSTI